MVLTITRITPMGLEGPEGPAIVGPAAPPVTHANIRMTTILPYNTINDIIYQCRSARSIIVTPKSPWDTEGVHYRASGVAICAGLC